MVASPFAVGYYADGLSSPESCQTSDGTIHAITVNRYYHSHDNGVTWPAESEMIIYRVETENQTRQKRSMQDAWAEMGNIRRVCRTPTLCRMETFWSHTMRARMWTTPVFIGRA